MLTAGDGAFLSLVKKEMMGRRVIELLLGAFIIAAFVMSLIALIQHTDKADEATVDGKIAGQVLTYNLSQKDIFFDNGIIVPQSVTVSDSGSVSSPSVSFPNFDNRVIQGNGDLTVDGATLTWTPEYYDSVPLLQGKKHAVNVLDTTVVRGFPLIVYHDNEENKMYAIRSPDLRGESFGEPVEILAGDVTLISVVSSATNVVVFYKLSGGNDILSVTSDGPFGDSWDDNAAVTVGTSDGLQIQIGSSLVKGLPTVCWGTNASDTVTVRQASDTDALAYEAAVNVTIVGSQSADMNTRSNLIEFAASSDTGDRLQYVVSQNSAGTAFETVVNIDVGAIAVGDVKLLYTDDARPFIVFSDQTNNLIKLAQSSTTDGLDDGDWSVTTVHSEGSDSFSNSFAAGFVNSGSSVARVVVFVYNETKKKLQLVQSTDNTMATFTYETFESNSVDDIGEVLSSVVTNANNWLVSYADQTVHDTLKFVNMSHRATATFRWEN
jgi:hypothetical protein